MQNLDFFGTKFGLWSHLGPSPKFGTSLEGLHFPPFHFPEAYQGGNAWPNDQNALKGVEGGGGSALCQDLSTVHRGPFKVIILNDNMIISPKSDNFFQKVCTVTQTNKDPQALK